jgi:hypothetical protein
MSVPHGIAELRRRTIDPDRLAGVTRVVFDDGPRRGVRALQARNAAGLSVTFVEDRALDASELVYRGNPLTWYGPGSATPPLDRDPDTDSFERTFFGGLVTTCGMDAFGPPGTDRWGRWPQHGHFNRLCARDVRYAVRWDDPVPVIEVGGTILQFRMFGEALRVVRTWRVGVHVNTITLHDRVTNDGSRREPHMLLYHCNIGFPMLDAATSWKVDASSTEPRDAVAAAGLDVWNKGAVPQAHFAEQVFVHRPSPDESGWATATATNPQLAGGTSLSIAFRPDQLPALFTWRMLGYGTYVMAAEPANCPNVGGRIAAENDGSLPLIEPGESHDYTLRFSVGGA